MAQMMRKKTLIRVSDTYMTNYSGSFRGRDRREARQLAAEWSDEIDEDRALRDLWCYLYRQYPADHADALLDSYDLPRPPSRERRTRG